MRQTRKTAVILTLTVLSFPGLLVDSAEAAQTASALLREGDTLPGPQTVSAISQPAVNHAGGYSVTVNTLDTGNTLSHVWGNVTGGPGAVIISEGIFGDYDQTSYESFHGLSNAGDPAYSAVATEISSGTTGLDGMWVGPTPILIEEQLVPSMTLQYSTFNSRPGISADGQPYWVGGFAGNVGGATENRALFLGVAVTPVLMGGDSIGGIPETVVNGSGGIDFNYRFSRFATNWIMESVVAPSSSSADEVVVQNANAVVVGGGLMREGSPVPAVAGGLVGENWENFDYFGINEAGLFLVTGDSSSDSSMDEFVFLGDQIVVREGDVISTPGGDLTVSGAIESAYMNEQADWVAIWDVNDPSAGNVEALLLNGGVMLKEGDPVDLNGDGAIEPSSILANFTGIAALALSDRDNDGFVSVYFTADIDMDGTPTSADDIEAVFRMTVGLDEVNLQPVAICEDQTVEAGSTCEADADVDGGSFDPDGDPITLAQDPTGPYGLGETPVTLTVTDDQFAFDICNASVVVVPAPLQLEVSPTALTWGPAVCDVAYDVVRGDLLELTQSGGNYAAATKECLQDDVVDTSLAYGGEPAAGEGDWYLVRRVESTGNGSYDSGAETQQGSRDVGIAFSGSDCP